MRKIFYILSLLVISMLPATAEAESVNHSAHHPAPVQESRMEMPMNDNMGMMKPGKNMGCPCCEKMGMQCGMMQEKMTSGQMMSGKMKGMQCMNMEKGKSKCGCCEKMMGTYEAPAHRSGRSYQFNQ